MSPFAQDPPHSGHAIVPEARRLSASAVDRITITAADSAHGCSALSSLARRCHTRGQLVLGGTAFADAVTAASTERGSYPEISAYTFVGTLAVQTNRTDQRAHRQTH
jgi:hypothetical protein